MHKRAEYMRMYFKTHEVHTLAYHTKRAKLARDLVIKNKQVPCADCTKSYPPYVMDFDHRGDKKFGLATVSAGNRSLKSIQLEIDKCDVVCSNCHRIRTHNRLT